jgi:hypothetical protein
MRTSGILRSVVLFTGVSGQRIGPIFKGRESEKKRNVGKQLPHDAA